MDRPEWLSQTLYPFDSRYIELDDGTLHYLDEGSGEPIVLVHGTPTWSFLYRSLVSGLSGKNRVIVPDHLGFGLSEKRADASYRPEDHARRLAIFIDELDLTSCTLCVHDFGGPIGLPYAMQHPEDIDRLVLFNTWCWSLRDHRSVRIAAFLARSPVGQLFYRRFNGSPRVLLKVAWGDSELPDEVHRHYTRPFPTPHTRTAPWVLARELIGSSAWYDSWWERRDAIVGTPSLIMWGLDDPTFGEQSLERWERTLTNVTVRRLPHVGHFVPDEASDRVVSELRAFLRTS